MAASVRFYFNILSIFFSTILCLESEKISEISTSKLESLIKDEPYVVLFLTSATCKTCGSAETVLNHIVEDAAAIDVKIVKTEDEAFGKQYGVNVFPNLLYFRDQRPMIYDGGFVGDEILDWLLNNKGVHVQHLSDETFEHLTQASTGATTGDWFVLFYQSSKNNQAFMTTWDTVAGRLNGKVNVAKLDVDLSRETAERFHITESTNLLFFRLGKVYRFDLVQRDALTLIAFASNWYKNVEGRPVIPPVTPFDKFINHVRRKLKGEHGIVYVSIGVSAVLLVFVFFLKYLNRDIPVPESASKKKA